MSPLKLNSTMLFKNHKDTSNRIKDTQLNLIESLAFEIVNQKNLNDTKNTKATQSFSAIQSMLSSNLNETKSQYEKCNVCEKFFKSGMGMSVHMRVHRK